MRFRSTRSNSGEVSFRQAVFTGLAPDGGLFIPVRRPDLRKFFASMDRLSFNSLAVELTCRLFPDDVDRSGAKRIVSRAFSFRPEMKSLDQTLHLLELFHGPTLAFKDFGATFLASVMEEFLEEQKRKAVILVATSGDTGSAVAGAFHGKKNIEVLVLYPCGRVSPLQEKQLTAPGGNIAALKVRGSFDDCQRLVKQAFLDQELNSSLNLTSANSINPGRLIPQAYYYIYALSLLRKDQAEKVFFCVPSGNFGNLTAGIYAWQWGLTAGGFIAATNINDVVPEFLDSGKFRPRSAQKTLSNAMDVGNPSNFERLISGFGGDLARMRRVIQGERVTDQETRETMTQVYQRYHHLVDPHTAVGLKAAGRFRERFPDRAGHIIVLATAHPGKFLKTVEEATGVRPELPHALEQSLHSDKEPVLIGSSFKELSSYLLQNYS